MQAEARELRFSSLNIPALQAKSNRFCFTVLSRPVLGGDRRPTRSPPEAQAVNSITSIFDKSFSPSPYRCLAALIWTDSAARREFVHPKTF